jgi:hypothetical protein
MRRLRNLRHLWLLGALALASVSFACRLDMLLKSKPPRAVLTISPAEVRDSARAGSGDERHATVEITNSGDGTLKWSASEHSPWLRLDPTDGDVPGALSITMDPEQLDPGVYESDITLLATASEAADTQLTTIPVTFVIQRPGLNVTPTTIERTTTVNSNESFTETLQVSNTGTGQLSWTASDDKSWISLGATSGNGNGSIQVTINTSGLGGGTYHGTITVTSPGAIGSPAHVAVTLNVLAPGLAVSPGSIRKTAPPGSTIPETDTLHVTNSGNGTITWTATKTAPWLSLSKTSGGAPDDIVVTLDPTGLPPGVQQDTIVFTSPEATNKIVRVPVEFTIAQPGLSVAPPSITASADQRDGKKKFELAVTNSAGGTLAWFASADQPWISLSAIAGLAPATLTVTLDPTGLAGGIYVGTVTVSSPGAAGSPFQVPVQFTITQKACIETALTPDVTRNGTLDPNDCEAPHRPGSLANLYGFDAAAGDAISIRMTSDFDGYLILTDAAGNVLAQNDACPGDPGAACITDFAITASGHYLIEATSTNPGAMGQLTISVVRERAPTAPQGLGQFRSNGTSGINVGDATPETEVVFKGKVDDPNQSQQVRLEIELEPLGSPFTGVATNVSGFVSAAGGGSQTSVRATGLTNNTAYRWQARACDNTSRCSEWLPFGNNADNAADFHVVLPPP